MKSYYVFKAKKRKKGCNRWWQDNEWCSIGCPSCKNKIGKMKRIQAVRYENSEKDVYNKLSEKVDLILEDDSKYFKQRCKKVQPIKSSFKDKNGYMKSGYKTKYHSNFFGRNLNHRFTNAIHFYGTIVNRDYLKEYDREYELHMKMCNELINKFKKLEKNNYEKEPIYNSDEKYKDIKKNLEKRSKANYVNKSIFKIKEKRISKVKKNGYKEKYNLY